MKEPIVEPATLCLLRHGDAGAHGTIPHRDRHRPLTEKGRKQAKRAGRALERLGLGPGEVWSSKLLRAQETAEIATAAAGAKPARIETADLAPDAPPERIVAVLSATPPAGARTRRRRDGGEDAPAISARWIVGHEPHLSLLLGHLTGAPSGAFRVAKGSVAVVEFPGGPVAAGTGRVALLLSPEALKELD